MGSILEVHFMGSVLEVYHLQSILKIYFWSDQNYSTLYSIFKVQMKYTFKYHLKYTLSILDFYKGGLFKLI